jgi:hypothetical protein
MMEDMSSKFGVPPGLSAVVEVLLRKDDRIECLSTYPLDENWNSVQRTCRTLNRGSQRRIRQ